MVTIIDTKEKIISQNVIDEIMKLLRIQWDFFDKGGKHEVAKGISITRNRLEGMFYELIIKG